MRCSVFTMYRRALKYLNDNYIIGKSMQNFTRDGSRIFMVRTGTGVCVPFIQSHSCCTVTITGRSQVHVQYLLLSMRTVLVRGTVILISHCLHWQVWVSKLLWCLSNTTLSKNINDSFTYVGVFPVFLCFLSGNLANACLHFIAFYLCVYLKYLLHI